MYIELPFTLTGHIYALLILNTSGGISSPSDTAAGLLPATAKRFTSGPPCVDTGDAPTWGPTQPPRWTPGAHLAWMSRSRSSGIHVTGVLWGNRGRFGTIYCTYSGCSLPGVSPLLVRPTKSTRPSIPSTAHVTRPW